jgi:citrate lyase subunit beta/citryl-CoA lyase
MNPAFPSEVLFDACDIAPNLPVCDHYAGVEARMRKSLALQAEMGPAFDITLDCEDGAPVGAERDQAHLVSEMAASNLNIFGRVGARVHPIDHPAFADDLDIILPRSGGRLAYLMIPKPRNLSDVQQACEAVDRTLQQAGIEAPLPLHFLIETHGALHDVEAIAAHPRVQSLSFGLMDYVSAHRGAIPGWAMSAQGQFSHPMIVRAKLAISAACHAHNKTPSHCVVTEFSDRNAIQTAAQRASQELAYTRMWSIHPDQIRPILEAFAPGPGEVELASEILMAARAASWAPIRHQHAGQATLHDRASFRFHWLILDRARRTGKPLATEVEAALFQGHTDKKASSN